MGGKGDYYVALDAKVFEHDQAIRELRESMIVLQRDQENLKQYVTEMKEDIKGDMRQMKSDIQDDFKTLRDDVMGALKSARDAWPKWVSIVVTGLGVLVAFLGYTHGR